jgi:hypothetical protein
MTFIDDISANDFDLDRFVQLAINDSNIRQELVNQMRSHSNIMVYYHCYYVLSKASKKKPDLFYNYWNDIADLLHHDNSYHRNFALDIIGNLTKVDDKDHFKRIEKKYFSLINDEKFNTGNECVKNLVKIYQNKRRLRSKILHILLEIDNSCDYTEKQKAVLKSDVLDIFDLIYDELDQKDPIRTFIKNEINSISPKTRKKAKDFIIKYRL